MRLRQIFYDILKRDVNSREMLKSKDEQYAGLSIVDSLMALIICNLREIVKLGCFGNDFDWLTLQFVNYWKGNGVETITGAVQVECKGIEETMTSQEVRNIAIYS